VAKILIVDDDPDMLDAGRFVLEAQGHEVIGASNVENGMKAVEEEKPNLLILDGMMEEPDDGISMARQLRRRGNDLPILMLTSVNVALGLHIDKDEEMVPVDEFVEKPVDPEALVDKVARMLRDRKGSSC